MKQMLPFNENDSLGTTGERIVADRYLEKGGEIIEGGLAMATLDKKRKFNDIVHIDAVFNKKVDVKTRDEEKITLSTNDVEMLKETTPSQMWKRVASGLTDDLKQQEEYFYLQQGWKYVPGGRISASMGAKVNGEPVKTTSYNCFVIPNVGPTVRDYARSFGKTLEIQARSGGVGMNLSYVPPQGTIVPVKAVDKTDLQLVLDIWHPDLLEFLEMKYPNAVKVVRINKEFQKAIAENKNWTFEFPETQVEKYDEIWKGDLKSWKKSGFPTNVGETIPAKELQRKMIASDAVIVETIYGKIVQPNDGRNSIAEKLAKQWEIQIQEKQVSVILSSLRPNHSKVYGVNGRSSGAHSWGSLYDKGNQVFADGFGPVGVGEIMSVGCQLTLQGGSRRGALMLVLTDRHADIRKFITAKQVDGVITGANVSVGISNEFMTAKDAGAPWSIGYVQEDKFEKYQNRADVDKEDFIEVDTLDAKALWNEICTSAWKSAEPGVIFLGRANEMSNSYYFNPLIASNPCGEQPLPANGICNLGAVNLSTFASGWSDLEFQEVTFKDKKMENHIYNELRTFFSEEEASFYLRFIKWEELERTTRLGIRFQNAVIDATYYPFQDNYLNQMQERRVGLGIMGLHDLLLYCGVRYGTEMSANLIDVVIGMMSEWAYSESARIAKTDGPFPAYDEEKFLASGFMQQMAKRKPHVILEIQENGGVRNVTTMTIAPTGTTGTMVGCSTGCEPYYAWEYFRNSRLGTFKEKAEIVTDYLLTHSNATLESLPEWFVTSMDLSPEDHIRVQGACQRWIDSSISKTCNAPHDYSVEDTIQLYDLAYELGCKGVTIYRDGSRSEQVLELAKEKEEKKEKVENKVQKTKRPGALYGATYKKDTPHGMAYITINDGEDGLAREIFVNIGKAGTDVFAANEALGRAITLYLKDSTNPGKEAVLVKHFSGIGGQNSKGFGNNRISSVPDAIAKAIIEHAETFPLRNATMTTVKEEMASGSLSPRVNLREAAVSKDTCPSCHQHAYVRHGGCSECEACGYSAC